MVAAGCYPRGQMRSLRSLVVAVALPVLVLAGTAACGDQGSTATGDPGSTVTGVVLSLDSTGGTIHGFTLRSTDGATMTFSIGTLETGGATFPASHLVVHAVSADPVSVSYRVAGGQNVVYRLTDAPSVPTASPSAGAVAPRAPSAALARQGPPQAP